MRRKIIRYLLALVFLKMVVVGLIWRFDVVNRSIEFDEGLFLYTADRIYEGQTRYTEDFDNMPPGIYYLYMLSFKVFGNDPIAGHMVSVVSDVGIIALLFAIGLLLAGPTAGFAAAGLYAANYVMIRWAPKGSTENPMTFFLMGALLLYLLAIYKSYKRSALLLFFSGVLYGTAFLIKQPALFFGLTIVGHCTFLHFTDEDQRQRTMERLVLFFAGFCVMVGVVALILAFKGVLGDALYNAFTYPYYAQRKYGMSFPQRRAEFLELGLFLMPVIFALGIGAGIAYLFNLNDKRVVPILYLVPVIFYLSWTGDFFQHYLIQLVPGLALAAGVLFAEGSEIEGKWFLKILLVVLVFTFSIANNTRMREAYSDPLPVRSKIFPTDKQRSFRDQHLDYQRSVGKYLRRNLLPGQKLVTSTPTYAYLAGVPNSYSQFYFAPLTQVASDEYRGLPEAAQRARFFVIESWRTMFLPSGMYDNIQKNWRPVKFLWEDDLEIWENPAFVPSPSAPQ